LHLCDVRVQIALEILLFFPTIFKRDFLADSNDQWGSRSPEAQPLLDFDRFQSWSSAERYNMLRVFGQCALCFSALMFLPSGAQAGLVIAGSFQGWSPATGAAMTDLGGGFFDASLTGLAANSSFEFKILDDQGNPPAAWGNPEWMQSNNWFTTDASGAVHIRLNTNIGSTGQNNMNVGISSGGWTPQLVGDFMNEAGGAGDWNPSDILFNMNNVGANSWQRTLTISTPGTYQIKITDGLGWDRQFGSDGFHNNPGTFSFTTVLANEQIIVNYNSLTPSFSVVPEPSSLVMALMVGLVAAARLRRKSSQT